MRAIILAAGRGLRLRQADNRQMPKCLLQFGGMSWLKRYLRMLSNAGVHNIVLALGYSHERVQAELDRLHWQPRPEIVLNPRFELGSVLTVQTVADAMTRGGDVLLVDADVLFDERIANALVADYVARDCDHMPHEEAVRDLLRERSQVLEVADVTGAPCIEIDFPTDVVRAAHQVLPQLLMVTGRGQPRVADEPQHTLMGLITPTMLDAMQIPWELFATGLDHIGPPLDRAMAHLDETGRPHALLIQKGSVAEYSLDPGVAMNANRCAALTAPVIELRRVAPEARPSRQEALRQIVAQTSAAATVVWASTGFSGRELYAIDDQPNQLYMVGSMGCVLPLARGLALARPHLRVVAWDGDGAALMRLGAFATVGTYGPANLQHPLLDNGTHDSTGGQATVSAQVSFAEVAAACGYAGWLETDAVGQIAAWLNAPPVNGPRFARLLTRTGTPRDLPRPSITPVEVKTRLMRHFGRAAGLH